MSYLIAHLHHNSYTCTKFQHNAFSGLGCALIDQSVTAFIYKDYTYHDILIGQCWSQWQASMFTYTGDVLLH